MYMQTHKLANTCMNECTHIHNKHTHKHTLLISEYMNDFLKNCALINETFKTALDYLFISPNDYHRISYNIKTHEVAD